MMNEIDEILMGLFPGEDVSPYKPRLQLLYKVLFEIADPGDKETLKREVAFIEGAYVEEMRLGREYYQNVTPLMLLETYSGVAYAMAKTRWETKEHLLCAKYLREIYLEIISNPYFEKLKKGSNARMVSDTIMDFAYASGKTENMSFRFHHWKSNRS